MALTELAHAQALRHRPDQADHQRAERLARSAVRACARLGMAPALAEATALLRELVGIGTVDIDALTARERQIAGLVADGLTNHAIAERLVISDRTVESHIRNLTTKLGLANRTQVAARMVRADLRDRVTEFPGCATATIERGSPSTNTEEKIMFARLRTYGQPPREEELQGWADDEVAELPGFRGAVVLATESGDTTALTLWGRRADAELLGERLPAAGSRSGPGRGDLRGGRGSCRASPPRLSRPRHSWVSSTDPSSTAQINAARRAGRERLAPTLGQVPGLVRVLVLWHPLDRKMTVMHLADSREALTGVTRAVTTTPLLPGRIPLCSPDRIASVPIGCWRTVARLGRFGRKVPRSTFRARPGKSRADRVFDGVSEAPGVEARPSRPGRQRSRDLVDFSRRGGRDRDGGSGRPADSLDRKPFSFLSCLVWMRCSGRWPTPRDERSWTPCTTGTVRRWSRSPRAMSKRGSVSRNTSGCSKKRAWSSPGVGVARSFTT